MLLAVYGLRPDELADLTRAELYELTGQFPDVVQALRK